jgi:sulfatase maturation enzyme AslB (radical SAM superfamily)
MCHRCNQEDQHGIQSKRIWARKEFADVMPYDLCIDNTSAEGTIELSKFKVSLFDVRIGNTCNLNCRSCWPGESTSWYKDWVKLGMTKININEVVIPMHKVKTSPFFTWADSPAIWEKIPLETLRLIHLSGGEPLYQKNHTTLLHRLIECQANTTLTLDYNSNLTKLPENILQLWKQFKEIRIGVSIDGVATVNDYIRNKSDWATIVQNFDKLAVPNINIWVTTTIMTYNALDITNILDWVLGKNSENKSLSRLISVHFLRNPSKLSIVCFPKSCKIAIAKHYESWLSLVSTRYSEEIYTELATLLHGIVEYMNSASDEPAFTEFIKYTEQLDLLRGQSFSQTFPELHRILNE